MIESHGPSGAPKERGREPAAEARWEKIQKQLDDALDATFPASEPVSIVIPHEEEEDCDEPESK